MLFCDAPSSCLRFEEPENKESGRIWVKYANGHEAPLEPKLAAGYMSQLGYRKCSEADHIRRDVEVHMEEQKKQDEQRYARMHRAL